MIYTDFEFNEPLPDPFAKVPDEVTYAPTDDPEKIILPAQSFIPRWYQIPLWRERERGCTRMVIIWPRRHGKDLNGLHLMVSDMLKRVGTYWIVYPELNQGRRILWNGIDNDGKPFLGAIPKELWVAKSEQEMRIKLFNGSIFQVMGADKPDRFVGANPVGIIFSEWSLINPMVWKLVQPILVANNGWALFIYTPRGKNHGWSLLNQAKRTEGWYWEHKTAKDLKQLSPETLRSARSELNDEALFQQEYFSSFEAPISGAYYESQFFNIERQKRISSIPVEPELPVYTGWDLGLDDSTAIWFAQVYGKELRLVHYYENRNKPLPHYVRYLEEFKRVHGIHYDTHFGPHDLSVRSYETGKTRLEFAKGLGLKFKVVKRHELADGIETVRRQLGTCYFDEVETDVGVSALKSYTKEYDESRKIYHDRPLHNWASHGADAFRTLIMGLKISRNQEAQEDSPLGTGSYLGF